MSREPFVVSTAATSIERVITATVPVAGSRIAQRSPHASRCAMSGGAGDLYLRGAPTEGWAAGAGEGIGGGAHSICSTKSSKHCQPAKREFGSGSRRRGSIDATTCGAAAAAAAERRAGDAGVNGRCEWKV